MHEGQFDSEIDATLSAIGQRRMVLPAVLFVAGHRPLAFVFGQILLILQPMAALLGSDGLASWAHLLSIPGGPDALSDRLAALLERDRHATRDLKSEP
ncbi:MAG: hypothetical protein OXI52_03430 [Caldilineaceae bacterium]|nr:hypothetical protein [Caldilineaceae bacterium]MDE0311292.1 hypothetical protein [Caldilineaceae bacterium]